MAIQLTQGQVTLVDNRDQEWLSKFKWCSFYNRTQHYAVRQPSRKDGKRKHIAMHRAIWEHHYGTIPEGMEIDHINGNGFDNRLENLRLCTHHQNQFNQRKIKSASSKFKGVYLDKSHRGKKWHSHIKIDGVMTTLGYFATEIEAARAYDAKAKEKFGCFANLNFPPSSQDKQEKLVPL